MKSREPRPAVRAVERQQDVRRTLRRRPEASHTGRQRSSRTSAGRTSPEVLEEPAPGEGALGDAQVQKLDLRAHGTQIVRGELAIQSAELGLERGDPPSTCLQLRPAPPRPSPRSSSSRAHVGHQQARRDQPEHDGDPQHRRLIRERPRSQIDRRAHETIVQAAPIRGATRTASTSAARRLARTNSSGCAPRCTEAPPSSHRPRASLHRPRRNRDRPRRQETLRRERSTNVRVSRSSRAPAAPRPRRRPSPKACGGTGTGLTRPAKRWCRSVSDADDRRRPSRPPASQTASSSDRLTLDHVPDGYRRRRTTPPDGSESVSARRPSISRRGSSWSGRDRPPTPEPQLVHLEGHQALELPAQDLLAFRARARQVAVLRRRRSAARSPARPETASVGRRHRRLSRSSSPAAASAPRAGRAQTAGAEGLRTERHLDGTHGTRSPQRAREGTIANRARVSAKTYGGPAPARAEQSA